METVIFCDGSYLEGTKAVVSAFVVTQNAKVIEKVANMKKGADSSSRHAEITAILSAIKHSKKAGYGNVTIFTDYKPIADKFNDSSLRSSKKVRRITTEASGLNSFALYWVSRENSYIKIADSMCSRVGRRMKRKNHKL